MSPSWKTLCEKCEHHIARYDKERSHVWYNHFCEKSTSRLFTSQVVNDPVPARTELPLDRRYDVCRNINTDNDCKLYEAAHE